MTRTAAREIAILLGFSVASGSAESAEESMERFFDAAHYASLAVENALFAEFADE